MGTLYVALYPSGQADPTDTQIITETVPNGVHYSEASPVVDGTAVLSVTGLQQNTSYKPAVVWDDGSGTSNLLIGAAFTTTTTITASGAGVLQQIGNQYMAVAASRLNGVLQ